LALTLILFALPLLFLWSGLTYIPPTLGRLLLFSGMLAVLLSLTRQNLQGSLMILALINAVACYLLAREIQHTLGYLFEKMKWKKWLIVSQPEVSDKATLGLGGFIVALVIVGPMLIHAFSQPAVLPRNHARWVKMRFTPVYLPVHRSILCQTIHSNGQIYSPLG